MLTRFPQGKLSLAPLASCRLLVVAFRADLQVALNPEPLRVPLPRALQLSWLKPRSAPGKAVIYELPAYLDVALKGLDVAALNSHIDIMSNSLQNLVPILDGSNYHRWADLMKAYLQQQQVWFVVELPDGITAPTLAEDGSNQNDVIAWTQMQSKALGSIRLRLNDEVAKVVKDKTTAKEVWNELKELYSVTSALGLTAS
ncbi:hypothetical protein NUW54_g5624 [Trametes sanguinea]|uniref:Uncharacterized protein n=1 Tax=Trametes sanguinea TaxID=158606 RepID=A0ACC1PUJ1_9APHY|nr:hypothetical protein NUW54_g5624 [Trametes sanguinea]